MRTAELGNSTDSGATSSANPASAFGVHASEAAIPYGAHLDSSVCGPCWDVFSKNDLATEERVLVSALADLVMADLLRLPKERPS